MIKSILKSTLFKSSGVYTISSFINASIPFFLIPVLTRYLSPEDYGMVSMFTITLSIASLFVGLNMHGAISRRFFSDQSTDFPRYIGNCIFILFLSTVIILLFPLLFDTQLNQFTGLAMNIQFIIIVISFFQFIVLILLVNWQIRQKPIAYGILQISQTLIIYTLTIFFIVMLKMKWKGRVDAQVLASGIFAIISAIILLKKKWVKFEYNKKDIQHALQFSLPLIPHAVGGLLITMTDRLFITNMIGLKETGIYTIAFQIGSVLTILVASFINAYVPWLYNKLNKNDWSIKLKIVKYTYLFFFIVLMVPVLATLVLPWFLSYFVDKSFVGANAYAIWIILGYSFYSMYLMIAGFIFYAEKTKYLAFVTFTTAIINIPICYIMIKLNGTLGAAQSTAIVYFLSFIFTWILSSRVYKMPWLGIFNRTKNSLQSSVINLKK